ncbi:hypothetical protein [Acetobacter fallax]|uniref:Chorismate lyase n=1 Tax=Acetobacter fallax TaxID=1737473 RepID=A0ABX0KA88_9PROT|nr:hypothetical protein [Acetobacter fallax]NHO33091.1 hypothetical protein [Acetobacter fallax]NHO36663.1 hypothetical protein [Acetobacter fallax]
MIHLSSDQSRLLQCLDEALLAASSATRALELWCEERRLFPAPVRIIASVERNSEGIPPAYIRDSLDVRAGETVRYRRVHLSSSGCVLSRAENWYVPARLTASMNHSLETTTEPFGRVVSPLTISRTTLENRRLRSDAGLDELLRHVAVLRRGDGTPISIVSEVYTKALLALRVDL